MTNLQAIDLLKGLEQSLDDYCELNDEGKTAFSMAITALELFGNSEQLPSAQPEERTEKHTETHTSDLISRIAVYERVSRIVNVNHLDPEKVWFTPIGVKALIEELPPAQPEEAIPVAWIKSRIERFKAEDNAFCGLTANIMHVMLNEWKREQEGETE